MSVDWNGAPDRGRMALPDTYKPKALRLATVADSFAQAYPNEAYPNEEEPAEFAPPAEPLAAEPHEHEPPVPPVVDLRQLEAELGRQRLDEIADVVRALTYGEMLEFAESVWRVKEGEEELTERNLPALLYRWSTSRLS